MSNPIIRPKLVCQYWRTDEPAICIYWDSTNTICTFQEEVISQSGPYANQAVIARAPYYPLCNNLGTAQGLCSKYDNGADVTNKSRCVLPDPVYGSHKTPRCGSWVVVPVLNSDGSGLNGVIDYSAISGYNSGNCDGFGTNITCSGFNAQNMEFGTRPIQEACLVTTSVSGSTDYIPGSNLPFSYFIRNCFAKLAPCYWWSGSTDFTLENIGVDKYSIKVPTFTCTRNKTESDEFSKYKVITEYQYQRPPCNGGTVDCPWYTGNFISSGSSRPYTSNLYLRSGDKILAEQILEIRYNIRKDSWDATSYKDSFVDTPEIYAFTGATPEVTIDPATNNIVDYTIACVRTYIADFECFTLGHEVVPLTKGTPSDNLRPESPTNIDSLKNLDLQPIIRSTFDSIKGEGATLPTGEIIYDFLNTENIFEVTTSDHSKILLVGDTFFRDNVIIAFNLSDPDFAFPFPDLLKYKTMADYKRSVINSSSTTRAENVIKFDDFHRRLSCYIAQVRFLFPEKTHYSEFSGENNGAFYIGVPTFFGKNDIIVFDSRDGNWGYDRISITKVFCGGLLAQTGFEVSGASALDYNYDYERFGLQGAFNTKLDWQFTSFTASYNNSSIVSTAEGVYSYFDAKMSKPSTGFEENNTILLGYTTYKVKAMGTVVLDSCNIKLLGNKGYMLVIIDDVVDGVKKLHNTIRSWEVEGDISLVGIDYAGNNASVIMEIYEYATDRMEVNQMVLRPKNANDYRRLYEYAIVLSAIYTYERRSLDDLPQALEYTVASGIDYQEGDTVIKYTGNFLINSNNTYSIDKLPNGPLVAAVVFKSNITGRVKGQVKSSLIAWVKQIYCSDVEIFYSWGANYKRFTLLPTGYCFVESIGFSYAGSSAQYYSPGCGDHYFGTFSTRPAYMWYPYTECDSYALYDVFSAYSSGEYDSAPMEFWLNSAGRPTVSQSEHGPSDLRMLGPSDNYGITTDIHAHFWACGCDWTHQNFERDSDIFFNGRARVRTGIDEAEMYYITRNGGAPPKFGNPHRDFIRSYRTNCSVYYYNVGDNGISVDKKWVPMFESYYDLNFTHKYQEYPFNLYFNTNDNFFTYYDQMAVLLAKNEVDNCFIDEDILCDEKTGEFKRYGFDEVFWGHSTTMLVAYPEPKVTYTLGELNTQEITSWYTFKPSEEWGDKTIQSVWRENWTPIKRVSKDMTTLFNDFSSSGANFDMCTFEISSFGSVLAFLDILYPNYTFDVSSKEHRRVCAEGDHVVYWYASTPLSASSSDINRPCYFAVSLDGGPAMLLDGTLAPVLDAVVVEALLSSADALFSEISNDQVIDYTKHYSVCTTSDWLILETADSDLEIFNQTDFNIPAIYENTVIQTILVHDGTVSKLMETEEQAKEEATKEGRVVITTDGVGYVNKYYYRGLVLNIVSNNLNSLPIGINSLVSSKYQYKLSSPSGGSSNFTTIVTTEYYPGTNTFGMLYGVDQGSSLTFELLLNDGEPKVVIDKIEVSFMKGYCINSGAVAKGIYNIPAATISTGIAGTAPSIVGSYTGELQEYTVDDLVESKVITYELNTRSLEFMNSLKNQVFIRFDYAAPEEERLADYNRRKLLIKDPKSAEAADLEAFFNTQEFMYVNTITVYTAHYISSSERIQTKERKFNVSLGNYGTIPIHGDNSSGSLLYPQPNQPTLYQYDTATGMFGHNSSATAFTSISKQRSRIASEIKADKLEVVGSYLDYEKEQSKIYNNMFYKAGTRIILKSCANKLLKSTLSQVGVTYIPEWDCTLEQNGLCWLKEVEAKKQYNPQGHKWYHRPDPDAISMFVGCGYYPNTPKLIFSYAWGRVSGMYGITYASDAIFGSGYENLIANLVKSFLRE